MNPAQLEDVYELSPLQQGLLYHSIKQPDSGLYFEQVTLPFDGPLNATALREAWSVVVAHHPILRTSFHWENLDRPMQAVHRGVELELTEVDWTQADPASLEQRFRDWLLADRQRGLELEQAPLMRLTLLRYGADRQVVVWSFHHVLLDGWSAWNVLSTVTAAYSEILQGRQPTLPRCPPYSDYIAWLRRQDLRAAEAYWRDRLSGFTGGTELPTMRDGDQGVGFDERHRSLDAAMTERLTDLARSQQITVNTVLQGAWSLLLSHYSGTFDVVFGTVVSGRPPELDGIESMVGLFINTLPVRVRVEPEARLTRWLSDLQGQLARVSDLAFSPLAEVQRWSDVPAGSPLFDSIFAYENYASGVAPAAEQAVGARIGFVERTNYGITLTAAPGTELLLKALFDGQRFDGAAIDRLLGHLIRLLEGFVARPDDRLCDYQLTSPDERARLLDACTGPVTEYPRQATIHQLFTEQAARAGSRPALVSADHTVSYRRLAIWSDGIGHDLRRLGVKPRGVIAISCRRSPGMVAGLLGILKAGCGYLPIDPGLPAERRAILLEDADAQALLVEPGGAADADVGVPVVEIAAEPAAGETAADADETAEPPVGARDLAYVLFTSGSTGRPKGVSVGHRAVVRLVRNTDFVAIDPDDVFLQLAPLDFDASTFEIWAPLLNGARLALFPPEPPTLATIAAEVERHKVTTLWLTAGLFNQLVDRHLDSLRGVRQLLAGGEALSEEHVHRALIGLPNTILINGYGPTENTTFSTTFRIRSAEDLSPSVPIGRPIANSSAIIVDDFGHLAPTGMCGELWVGGDGLAIDYLNRQELSEEKFVSRSFNDDREHRMYRTGDIVRARGDGEIQFLGRRDFQVKLRGYRIELGEVEAALRQVPAVHEATAMVREDRPGDKRLVAYISAPSSETLDEDAIRGFLEGTLPAYMLPNHIVTLESLPLTANGKLDRSALPVPTGADSGAEQAAPASEVEEIVAEVWQEVLGLDRVAANADFFRDLGGHSLLATQAVSRIRSRFEIDLTLEDFFATPRIDALAPLIEEAILADELELLSREGVSA